MKYIIFSVKPGVLTNILYVAVENADIDIPEQVLHHGTDLNFPLG